jgi:hypothetical protein
MNIECEAIVGSRKKWSNIRKGYNIDIPTDILQGASITMSTKSPKGQLYRAMLEARA